MASTEPAPGEIPPASSTWATDPLSGPVPTEKTEPGERPVDLPAEVRASQPGVWPTSAFDLDDDPPGNGTGPESFDFLGEPGHDPLQAAAERSTVKAGHDLFTVHMQITPLDQQGSTLRYELSAVGSAADVYAMIEGTVSRFVDQVAPGSM